MNDLRLPFDIGIQTEARIRGGMMATGYKFGDAMEALSGIRSIRWRVLLAHDTTAVTCDPLTLAIATALGSVDINDASSVEDGRAALQNCHFHVCLVCLDLPPAPLGGVRLAQEMVDQKIPVVLVTRSLRWVPATASTLRDLPWIPPDATPAQVGKAVSEALAVFAARAPLPSESDESSRQSAIG